jgi:hypothetical protein
MLDIFDFIVEKGGNPQKIKESQRQRGAPEEAVDEVIALYEDHRKSKFESGISIPSSIITRLLTFGILQPNTPRRRSTQKSTTPKNKLVRRRRPRRMQTSYYSRRQS